MLQKISLLILLMLTFKQDTKAYYELDTKLSQAHSEILTLHFDVAGKLLQEEIKTRPGNNLCYLFLNYIDFLKAFLSEEESDFETLKKNSAGRIEIMDGDKTNSLSPFYLYAQSEMLIQQSLVKIKFGENISSANEIRKAFKLIEQNKKTFPAFILNDKVEGFLSCIIGAVPPKFKWVTDLTGLKGSVTAGLKELQNVYSKIPGTQFSSYSDETLFYIANIYSIFLLNNDSLAVLNQIKERSSKSPLIGYIYSNIIMKQGKNDEAIQVLTNAISDRRALPFYFLYYKRGLARLRNLDLTAASDFEYFLSNNHGKNNIKSAIQKLAWIKLIGNNSAGYNQLLTQIKTHGNAIIDDDKDAVYESEKTEPVNKILLKARLLFDGGYYLRALKEITGKPLDSFPTFHDQLEVTYRLARIMQMTGQVDKAIQNYQATIKNGASSGYYFAANSALLLGNIFEKNHQKEKAKQMYRTCLSMDYKEYKNGIDQKAKAGLDRLEHIE